MFLLIFSRLIIVQGKRVNLKQIILVFFVKIKDGSVGGVELASYLLKDKIKETIRVINRDIVDAEKQLREG